MAENFVLKGNICYSQDSRTLICVEQGYLVCADGESAGVYKELPQMYAGFPLTDYGDRLIVPGLTDLHLHAPQYSFRGLGMDLELLEWLNTRTFPEAGLQPACLLPMEGRYGFYCPACCCG